MTKPPQLKANLCTVSKPRSRGHPSQLTEWSLYNFFFNSGPWPIVSFFFPNGKGVLKSLPHKDTKYEETLHNIMNETFYGAPIKGNDTEAIWSIGHVFPFANSLHWFPRLQTLFIGFLGLSGPWI